MVSTGARRAVVAVVVGVLAVGGWLEWRHKDYHEHISGPRGPFPAALGRGAPAAPDRVLPRTADSYGVDGPLAIDTAQGGIVARDLRTGKEFWHYGRDRTELGEVAFTGDGDTVATWWQDGVVAGTDLRSGKPRWHAEAAHPRTDDFAGLQVIDGLVVAYSPYGITAFDEHGGKRVWRGAVPRTCRLSNDTRLLAVPDSLAVSAECTGTADKGQLLAFDSRTGRVRWQLAGAAEEMRQADDHTLATLLWKPGLSAVIDVSGRKPVVTTMPAPTDYVLQAAGAGIMLSGGDSGPVDDGRLVAYGLSDARPRWKRLPAKGTRFGLARLLDGRVYVVQQPQLDQGVPKSGRSDLLVLDARTGRRLHDTPLPALPLDDTATEPGSDAELVPWQASGGSVAIRWDEIFGSLTGDLVVVTR